MCFSLQWIEQVLIWFVIVCAVIAILKALLPWVVGMFGVSTGPLLPIINIIVMAIVAIYVIYIVFELLSCLLGSGGHLSLPHGR